MRWSQAFIPTLRDDPADAEAASHRLLVRGGFVRQLSAGHYSMLPLGERVRRKIITIIRQEMDRIGGQQFHLPALHPAEIWKRSGRWEAMGGEMFRLKDRKGVDHALGMTHEEVFALLATELFSYRDLPQIWYQIQTKFRDEPRPKSGLLRVREFTMKDAYSLDLDSAGLDFAFEQHRSAYLRIFTRCGLEPVMAEASSGTMGGTESVEFIVRSDIGEDWIVTCPTGDYAANLERATTRVEPIEDPAGGGDPQPFPTPGVRTIAALAEFDAGAPPDRQIKTLVYMLNGHLSLVLLRGDHDLHEQKLVDAIGTANIRPAQPDEVREALGASPGSLGAVGVTDLPVIADPVLRLRRGMVTGANVDDRHLRGVDVDRDITVSQWADLRTAAAGEPCINCGTPVDLWRGIEVGHIFKLGTRYSVVMGALVQDQHGTSQPIVMGSYGIGVERTLAAVVEWSHDDKGIVWPVPIAPYEVVVTVLRGDHPETVAAGERIYRELADAGVDVIIDDRSERPGVKFADAELVGIPYRVTVGPKGLAQGLVEVTTRRDGATDQVPLGEVSGRLGVRVVAER